MASLRIISVLTLLTVSVVFHTSSVTAEGGTLETVKGVATTLVGLFSTDEEYQKDLTAAEEDIRGLTFDLFDEKVSCKVLKEIAFDKYGTLIDRLATRFSLPDTIKESLLDGEYAVENYETVVNFRFNKGETGDFIYGRVATLKTSKGMDMAYSVYQLAFKLAPKQIRHEKKTKFLFFTTDKKVWTTTEERNLSNEEGEHLSTYFMNKAIKGFKREYAGVVEQEKKSADLSHGEL